MDSPRLPNPTKGQLAGISRDLAAVSCTSASACTAVGDYVPTIHPDSPENTLAERWNGTRWAIQPTPILATTVFDAAFFAGVSCPSRRVCIAVGQGLNGATLAERWNGRTWKVQATPGTGLLSAVSCTSASACTAVGGSLAERWNGSKWTIQATPVPAGSKATSLTGVACSSDRACTAVGHYEDGNGSDHALAEAWDGTKWAIQQTPDLGSLANVSCSPAGVCSAVGQRNSSRTLVERRS